MTEAPETKNAAPPQVAPIPGDHVVLTPLLFSQAATNAPVYLMEPWPKATTIMPGMIDNKLVARATDAPNVIYIRPANGFAAYAIESEMDELITLTFKEGVYEPVETSTTITAAAAEEREPDHLTPAVPPVTLRADGPTLTEWVAAGYVAESYPPRGYAAREEDPAPVREAPAAVRTVDHNGKIIA